MTDHHEAGPDRADATGEAMGAYWDSKARENAMFFIHSCLDFNHPDEAEFWESGAEALDLSLAPFGVRISPDDRVLEIGCGIGRITKAIAARARSVVGLDVSPEMVARAERALGGVANARFVVGSGTDLAALDDDAFDACYSFIVFQHIPDPAITCRYVTDMGRVLRPGGWAVFQVSERPEQHQAAWYGEEARLPTRVRRALGRAPRGCLEPQWLGSAVRRADLVDAIEQGGLELVATSGDGTQFCMVHVRRPG
ncbi:MAG: methyltransferase domain-containing protein [Actinobacteria bacterium]|nr:methyltransferase domain-containing protein [Actinomycetota bacterium]